MVTVFIYDFGPSLILVQFQQHFELTPSQGRSQGGGAVGAAAPPEPFRCQNFEICLFKGKKILRYKA